MSQILKSSWKWGLFWSFTSSFLWATVYVSARYLMRGEQVKVDPVTLSLLRFSIGGFLLFALCFFTMGRKLFSLPFKDLLKIALLSQFSFVGMSIFLFWGQRYTTAVNSSMIMSSSPVLTMLFGLFIGERITLLKGVGMAVATTGCMMVIGVIGLHGFGYTGASPGGDGLVLLAALSWAIGAVLAKKLLSDGKNELAVTAWSMLFAASSLLIITCFRLKSVVLPVDGSIWCFVIYLAVFPTALGFFAWNAALSRISLNLVNIMQYLTPIMTILMAWGLLKESLNPFQIAGIALVLSGIAFSVIKRKKGDDGDKPDSVPFPKKR